MKNKKAAFGATLTLTVATIAIILLILVFLILSSFITKGISGSLIEEPKNAMFKEQSYVSLLSYLNTEVEFENQKMTFADLIRAVKLTENENYEQILNEKSAEIFDSVYSDYVLTIDGKFIKGNIIDEKLKSKRASSINVPLNKNEKIEISLIIK